MKQKLIPLEKQSRKEQRRYHASFRGDWNGVVPVTRIIPNKKKSSRHAEKTRLRAELE